MAEDKKGYVYILTNPSFREDWVKIGKSSRPVDVRSKELDNTAVPLPFDIFATLKTAKYDVAERNIHRQIDRLTDLRIRKNREFFNIQPQVALEIFKDVAEMLDHATVEIYKDNKVVESICYGKQSEEKSHHLFFAKNKFGADAKGFYNKEEGTFTVLKGSKMLPQESASFNGQKKRQEVFKNHCLFDGTFYVLKENCEFPTPSSASDTILGRSSNGWTLWIDADKKTLDEIYRKK